MELLATTVSFLDMMVNDGIILPVGEVRSLIIS